MWGNKKRDRPEPNSGQRSKDSAPVQIPAVIGIVQISEGREIPR